MELEILCEVPFTDDEERQIADAAERLGLTRGDGGDITAARNRRDGGVTGSPSHLRIGGLFRGNDGRNVLRITLDHVQSGLAQLDAADQDRLGLATDQQGGCSDQSK